MALGELSFVEEFIENNTGPFRVDNLILISVFMIVMPIALMNLLIGVAVGDIDAIKSESAIMLIALRVSIRLTVYQSMSYAKTSIQTDLQAIM